MKQCIRCGASKDESEFALNRHRSKIYRYRCNAMIGCARERIHILTQAAAYLYADAHPDTRPVQAQIAFVGPGTRKWLLHSLCPLWLHVHWPRVWPLSGRLAGRVSHTDINKIRVAYAATSNADEMSAVVRRVASVLATSVTRFVCSSSQQQDVA